MIDREVDRLRRLRAVALKVRTVAGALAEARDAGDSVQSPDPLLTRGRCAAWRVARTVSGRLRAHPYASFHKDAGFGVVLANGLVAANALLGVKNRHQSLVRFETHLRSLARELSDVRALTCAPDLNDSFARSQIEIRALLAALAHETGLAHHTGKTEGAASPATMFPVAGSPGAGAVDADWPYLAF